MSWGQAIRERREEAIKERADEASELRAKGNERPSKANFFFLLRSFR